MDKEVDPAVIAVINEKRLTGEKRTPVDIISRMGVFDAREKASDQAWLASGDNVIITIWAEFVSVGAGGRWFYLESLDTHHRLGGGGERTALQSQRAKDRLQLLKRSLDLGLSVRAVLQTNRVAIAGLETDKAAKVSVRVQDEQEWHVAAWDADEKVAVLVRGPRGWLPNEDEVKAARARGSVPPVAVQAVPSGDITPESVHAAAIEYLTKHFAGYGYKPENVSSQKLGYDIEVTDKKGKTLLKLAVKGTAPGVKTFKLTDEERTCAKKGDPWRMVVVTDAIGPAAQHKIYKPEEVDKAPGLEL
ncbi:DUF3883 domain-containing protein [Variovorax sp. dw_954]|uniref:protein NO VEIN domain-containing protein n=1 Tax=Variovorax sp. dw_954 TaxID=2720078 RepID=UPI001BD59892|nr:DUF3883 domain-containing protein [Variovorax sp. dw_954]